MRAIYVAIFFIFWGQNWVISQHTSQFTSVCGAFQTAQFQLPATHTFQVLIRQDEAIAGGVNMPDNFDFTGYVPPNPNNLQAYLGINHEMIPGGMTIFDIAFDTLFKRWNLSNGQRVDFSAVGGTARNCSGTVTPWGTLVTSEEIVLGDTNLDNYNDFGWNVEIAPASRSVRNFSGGLPDADKLWALGCVSHENIIVHANRRTVYEGSDSPTGYLLKFVADSVEKLNAGSLYVYKQISPNTGEWILLQNTTPAQQNSTNSQAAAVGARVFNGIEDVEIGLDGKVYFAVKNEHCVYRFQDNNLLGGGASVSNFEVFVGGAGVNYQVNCANNNIPIPWGTGNDNLAFDDLGNLWVLQDGSNNYIWVVKPGHTQANSQVQLFGIAPAGAEPTGITFTPDYKFLFMSFQHPSFNNNSSTQLDAFGNSQSFDRDIAIVIARKGNLGTVVLPVQWGELRGVANYSLVELTWDILSEENNHHFKIQRGSPFSEWKDIGTVNSNSFGTFPRRYSWIDKQPFIGKNYYRIVQVDVDGNTDLSDTIEVVFEPNDVIIYPNPIGRNDFLAVFFRRKTTLKLPYHLSIWDSEGRLVYTEDITDIPFQAPYLIGLEVLPSGIYRVKIQNEDAVLVSSNLIKW